MKKLYYSCLGVGAILILLAALFKEMHWEGKKELTITGICVLLVGMLIYLYMVADNRKIN